MLRLRRHPAAGLSLVAALVPLLAAGPVTLCGKADIEHGQASRAAASHQTASDGVKHAACADQVEQNSRRAPGGELGPSPEEAPLAPSAPCCSMGMTCSGSGITSPSAAIASEQIVLAVQATDPLRVLSSAESTLPERPPRA